MITYSVVIPLKDEESNILTLIEELETAMSQLKKPWELICVDDGSSDQTPVILKELSANKKYLKPIFFNKNYGQSAAFSAGFKSATGEYVITLDGDGQNDPADIPLLLKAIKNSDLVCGKRMKRKDTFSKRITSKVANGVRKWLCDDGVQDTGCSLKVYRKKSLDQIKMFKGMHRFLPALFIIEGFKVAEVPVNHRPRTNGQSKYNFWNRSLNTVIDLLAVRWMKSRHINYQERKK